MADPADQMTFPPKDFHYGGRKPTGDFEWHPIFPKACRTPEHLTEMLVQRKRLVVPDIYLHKTCAGATLMGPGIAETILVSPKWGIIPYRRIFCSTCKNYYPTGEFVFADNGEPVDARLAGPA